MRRRHAQHGFALITVLGVMLLLVVYLATVQGSILATHRLSKIDSTRLDATEAAASLIELALAQNAVSTQTLTLTLQAPNGLEARVSRMPLPAGHALWRKYPAIQPLAGDELLTIEWAVATPPPADQFITNAQRLRQGVISLGLKAK